MTNKKTDLDEPFTVITDDKVIAHNKEIADKLTESLIQRLFDSLGDVVEDTSTPFDDYMLGILMRSQKLWQKKLRRRMRKEVARALDDLYIDQ